MIRFERTGEFRRPEVGEYYERSSMDPHYDEGVFAPPGGPSVAVPGCKYFDAWILRRIEEPDDKDALEQLRIQAINLERARIGYPALRTKAAEPEPAKDRFSAPNLEYWMQDLERHMAETAESWPGQHAANREAIRRVVVHWEVLLLLKRAEEDFVRMHTKAIQILEGNRRPEQEQP